MTIESARHRPDGSIVAVIDGNPQMISADPSNPFRKLVEAWGARPGNVIEPHVEPEPEPEPVELRRRAAEIAAIGEPVGPVMRAVIDAIAGETAALDGIRAELAAIEDDLK
jgi:hypothetical protein